MVVMMIYIPALASSVPPQLFPGNDMNPNDYTPPANHIHYQIPNSADEGTHTLYFDEDGNIVPDGPYSFTIIIGTAENENYTKVLSWSSNFPIYGVIVKGGNAFNLYQYENTVRGDTNLVSPNNVSGDPADVSHVSIVFNPNELPPDPPIFCLITNIILIIAFFLIGLILGIITKLCKPRKPCKPCKPCKPDRPCDPDNPYDPDRPCDPSKPDKPDKPDKPYPPKPPHNDKPDSPGHRPPEKNPFTDPAGQRRNPYYRDPRE